jgi:hypothetical protein
LRASRSFRSLDSNNRGVPECGPALTSTRSARSISLPRSSGRTSVAATQSVGKRMSGGTIPFSSPSWRRSRSTSAASSAYDFSTRTGRRLALTNTLADGTRWATSLGSRRPFVWTTWRANQYRSSRGAAKVTASAEGLTSRAWVQVFPRSADTNRRRSWIWSRCFGSRASGRRTSRSRTAATSGGSWAGADRSAAARMTNTIPIIPSLLTRVCPGRRPIARPSNIRVTGTGRPTM